ncbi:hypothetical protein bcCo53_001207 (plasmid) [Borrelia coriaceae]|uniref:hypothetical protein n=1 Tax=Borrelia coriaceae TaxID=144 RepID=UPI00046CE9F3|nr:hypothetical protein [Borrelia coriaceae]UPA17038.1 hypothetical protein bcCo53_001207 [Borrelia coriaceae]
MYIRFISVIRSVFLFCVLCVFLLSFKFETYCEQNVFCYRKYSEEFGSGDVSSISFWEQDLTPDARENVNAIPDDEEGGVTTYKSSIQYGFPAYFLEFVIASEPRGMNFKDVIFDGVEAEVSIFDLYEPSAQLVEIKDFQIGPPDVNAEFRERMFPMPVHNIFTISLRRGLVDKLKGQKRIKITLISTDGKEFVLDTENFISKYDF